MLTQEAYDEIDTISVFVDYIMPEIQKSVELSMSSVDPKIPGNLLALQIAADYAIGAWVKDQKLRHDTPENHVDLTGWPSAH